MCWQNSWNQSTKANYVYKYLGYEDTVYKFHFIIIKGYGGGERGSSEVYSKYINPGWFVLWIKETEILFLFTQVVQQDCYFRSSSST